MKLARYNYPSLLNDFDNWLSDPQMPWVELTRLFENLGAAVPSGGSRRMPADVYEDEGNFHVRFEVPGVKREDLKLEVEGGVLTVSFERKTEAEGRSESLKSSRAVRLPDGADLERSTAKLEDGVLTVTFAKHEAKKPRAIEIG